MSGVYVSELECSVFGLSHLAKTIAAKADGNVNALRWKDWHKRAAVEYWCKSNLGVFEVLDALDITLAEFQEWCRDFAAHRSATRERLKGYASQ